MAMYRALILDIVIDGSILGTEIINLIVTLIAIAIIIVIKSTKEIL